MRSVIGVTCSIVPSRTNSHTVVCLACSPHSRARGASGNTHTRTPYAHTQQDQKHTHTHHLYALHASMQFCSAVERASRLITYANGTRTHSHTHRLPSSSCVRGAHANILAHDRVSLPCATDTRRRRTHALSHHVSH